MRMGNMGYIYFNLVFDKGHKGAGGSPCPLRKADIHPILMKFKPYVLATK